MGSVILLEDLFLDKGAKNPFSDNHVFNVSLSPQKCYAAEFIGRYLGVNEDNFLTLPIDISSLALKNIHQNCYFDDFLDKFCFTWDYASNYRNDVQRGKIMIQTPTFFNMMLNEKKYTPNQLINLMYDHYIQSFVDSYNGKRQEYGIFFHDKKTARKIAMMRRDQKLIEDLNIAKKILGFKREEIVYLHQ